jgi:hypothetical protein
MCDRYRLLRRRGAEQAPEARRELVARNTNTKPGFWRARRKHRLHKKGNRLCFRELLEDLVLSTTYQFEDENLIFVIGPSGLSLKNLTNAG